MFDIDFFVWYNHIELNFVEGFMRNLDDNLKKMMKFIVDFKDKNGYLPSVREIAKEIGVKSTSTINYYINILEQKNLIKRSEQKNKARAFEIVRQAPKFVRYNEYCPEITNIPLLGTVTAGIPILAVENIESQFGFPEDMFGREDLFMLNVTGESMIDAGIFNNDLIIVHKQNYADNGEIVVALLEDCATVKRFYKEENRIRLQPENKTMTPIFCDNVTILGKVVGLIRKIK